MFATVSYLSATWPRQTRWASSLANKSLRRVWEPSRGPGNGLRCHSAPQPSFALGGSLASGDGALLRVIAGRSVVRAICTGFPDWNSDNLPPAE